MIKEIEPKERDERKSHISSKVHMIYMFSNNVTHPVIKILTVLQYTSPNHVSLHFTTLVDNSLPLI